MIRPAPSSAVLAPSEGVAADGGGSLGPTGVWPPPQYAASVGFDADDSPTIPLPTLPGPLPRRHSGGAPGPPAAAAAWSSRFTAAVRRLAPKAWRGARVDPGRPGATALCLVAAAAAIVAAVGVWMERPRAEPVAGLPGVVVDPPPAAQPADGAGPAGSAPVITPAPAAPGLAAPPAAGSAAAAAPPAMLVVSVSGKVRRPGLVEVPQGARVADVLEAAGGALPGTDLAALNLARRVVDGEQVAVGVPPAPDALPAGGAEPVPDAGAGSGPAPGGKVDLNTATVAQLDALPGVGPVTAQRILEWRTRNGRFSRVEQLREVEGIGERRFAQLRDLVTV
jgi:competence protein ComEA